MSNTHKPCCWHNRQISAYVRDVLLAGVWHCISHTLRASSMKSPVASKSASKHIQSVFPGYLWKFPSLYLLCNFCFNSSHHFCRYTQDLYKSPVHASSEYLSNMGPQLCSRHWDNSTLMGKLNLVLSQQAHRTTQREGSFFNTKAMPFLPENNTPGKAVVPRHFNGMTLW